jgi:transcriptional regulator with XRE-family HTH domain
MEYSNIILKIRAKLNITQQQLAEMLKVTFATVNRWENGKITPSKRYIYLLEEICKENNIEFKGSEV